jgi:lysophospholipase L1-like esterase
MPCRGFVFVVGVLMHFSMLGQSLAAAPDARAKAQSSVVMVAVGDSITAGMANATLAEETQRLSYPNLIARQMQIAFGQPYIQGNGVPALLFRFDRNKRQLIMGTFTSGRRATAKNDQVHNFAVPNARLWEVFSVEKKSGKGLDTLVDAVLLGQGTQVEQARRKQPDLIIVWAGNNDLLHVVQLPPDDREGKKTFRLDDRMTPLEDFRWQYQTLIDRLSAPYPAGPKKGRKPDVVVATIPDMTDLPILVPLGKPLKATTELPFTISVSLLASVAFPSGGTKLLTKENLEKLELTLTKLGAKDEHPAGSMVSLIACMDNGLNGDNALFAALKEGKRCFSECQVLTPHQLARIRSRTDDYNKAIKEICKERKIPVVDIHARFKDAAKDGIMVGKTKLTTAYTGGLFSLDAIHPTHTANAILANAFIEVINDAIKERKAFGGRAKPNYIPTIKVEDVLKNDPQRPRP